MTNQDTIAPEEQMSENRLEKSDSPIQADMDNEKNNLVMLKSPASNLICNICKET